MRRHPMGRTATGTTPAAHRTVACDPSLLGKKIYLEGIGYRICEDTGGNIKGRRVDVFLALYREAVEFGTKVVPFTEI